MSIPARLPCDAGAIAAGPDTGGCAERAKPWVLAATIVGSSMAFIDGSVVSVALPAMQRDLAASVAGMQWIVNAYTLLLGALMLVGGSAGDRFGRRRVFVIGIILFTLASVACGLAPGTSTLVAARALQGLGGALLVPSSLAIISAAFSKRERGRAIGTWAGFSAITTALGPVLGGWLVDSVSWRAIFFINVPVAAVAVGIALWRVPESRDEAAESEALDWRGALLATAGLGAVTYGLIASAERGWTDPAVLGALLGGAVLLAVFLTGEARHPAPMVPLGMFRSSSFSGANLMTLFLYMALAGAFFFLPFNLIQVQGYSATLAGAAFLPFTLVMGALSRWSGGLVDRYGARKPLIVGPIIAAAGFALLAVAGDGGSYWIDFFPPMLVLGFGMAVSVAPLTTTVMGAVAAGRAGLASGINNAVSRLAGLLAIAALGVVAVGTFAGALDERLQAMNLPAEARSTLAAQVENLAGAQAPPGLEAPVRRAVEQAIGDSFLQAFREVMLIAAALALLSAACAAAMIQAGPADTTERKPSRGGSMRLDDRQLRAAVPIASWKKR